MTDSPRVSIAPMEMVLDEFRTASGGVPDAWANAGLVNRRQVAAVNARVARHSRLFIDARSVRPNIDFTQDRSVKSVEFVPAVLDDDFDW